MQNLNKYTKSELINKLKDKRLEVIEPNSMTKLISKILLFKSLILKLTLFTFIIRWIKKYSLVRKLWQVFSMIGSTLLGLSLVDIYAFDFINWIKDTNFYRWYSELFNIKSEKIIETKTEIKEPSSGMRTSNTNSTGDETKDEKDYGIIRKIHKITNPEPDPIIEDIENPSFYSKNKYWIIGAASVTCLIGWYYYGDNIQPVINSGIEKIKTGYGAIIDYLNSFRPSPPDDSTGTNSSGSAISNTMTDKSRLSVQDRIKQYFDDKTPQSNIIVKTDSEIELIDTSQASTSNLDKGKGVLTSPSLENLNNQAQESWSEGSSSPKSESSSSTITPSKIESSSSPSSESIKLEFISENWQKFISENASDKIKVIENIFSDENEITKDQANILADSLASLVTEYNEIIDIYKRPSYKGLDRASKQAFYHFRQLLYSYHDKIWPTSENPIIIGSLTDELEKIIINKK